MKCADFFPPSWYTVLCGSQHTAEQRARLGWPESNKVRAHEVSRSVIVKPLRVQTEIKLHRLDTLLC